MQFFTWSLISLKFDVQTCSHAFLIDDWHVDCWSLKVSLNAAFYCIQTEYPTGLDGWCHAETPLVLNLLTTAWHCYNLLYQNKCCLPFPPLGSYSQNIWYQMNLYALYEVTRYQYELCGNILSQYWSHSSFFSSRALLEFSGLPW